MMLQHNYYNKVSINFNYVIKIKLIKILELNENTLLTNYKTI